MENSTRAQQNRDATGDGFRRWHGRFFAGTAGLLVGLGLFKFGNPVIFEGKIIPPRSLEEMLHQIWPVHWVYFLWGTLLVAGLPLARFKKETPKWVLILPFIWLAWQFLAATQTVDAGLTSAVLKHLTACVVSFFIGWLMLSEVEDARPFWVIIVVAFLWLMRIGFEQHFGGLEATRRYFEMYLRPTMPDAPPELVKRFSTTRIFGTLFYPNSLAGAILLLLPTLLAAVWELAAKVNLAARWALTSLVGLSALVCLYWSGSKAGWLLLLGTGLMALFRLPFRPRLRRNLVIGILVIGLAGFFAKYAGFFQRGATSVSARFDYWRSAISIATRHPVMGTGPGTFSIPYLEMKRPEAEMARLCHNDYLEQASDSGIVPFVAYSTFILGSICSLYRKRKSSFGFFSFAMWLGVAAWALHGFLEFHLYVPGLAYPFFLMLGWLWGDPGNRIDNSIRGN